MYYIFYAGARSPGYYRIIRYHTNGLVQDCSNSSALAMELLQSCTEPSTLNFLVFLTWGYGNICNSHVTECMPFNNFQHVYLNNIAFNYKIQIKLHGSKIRPCIYRHPDNWAIMAYAKWLLKDKYFSQNDNISLTDLDYKLVCSTSCPG